MLQETKKLDIELKGQFWQLLSKLKLKQIFLLIEKHIRQRKREDTGRKEK